MTKNAFNGHTHETEAGRFLWNWGEPGLYWELQPWKGYIMRLSLKKQINQAYILPEENQLEGISHIFLGEMLT